MGRTRSFDEPSTLAAAGDVFRTRGYEGTSIDDLVTALGLHRGSLYHAYGSKRGVFVATLHHHLTHLTGDAAHRERALDLLLVAAVERGPVDAEVADLVRTALDRLDAELPAATARPAVAALSDRLLQRLAAPSD